MKIDRTEYDKQKRREAQKRYTDAQKHRVQRLEVRDRLLGYFVLNVREMLMEGCEDIQWMLSLGDAALLEHLEDILSKAIPPENSLKKFDGELQEAPAKRKARPHKSRDAP